MITITEQPPSIADFVVPAQPPVPLSDCLRWCMLPDTADVISTAGAKATLVIVIPAACTVPANGTPFTIWGHDFTVDSAQDFTSSSFKVDAIGIFTWIHLASMFYSNIFFQRSVVITGQLIGADFELTITWIECREQGKFSGANMDLAVFTTIGGSATATNGTSPVYVEAFRLLVRASRYVDATSGVVPLSVMAGLEVERLCSTVGATCVILNKDIGSDLYTILPALTNISYISAIDNGRSMMRFYGLEYGWTYRENCVSKSGTIKVSDRVLVLNAAFDIDDPYQMRRYWHDHPDGLPPDQSVPDYLTTQPKSIKLCQESFKWLWLLNSWEDDFGQHALVARWVAYKADGTIHAIYTEVINDPLTMGSSPYQAVCFNASPDHLFSILGAPIAQIAFYEIQVVGTEPLDHNDILFNASEYLRFYVEHCCEEFTDLYFLSPTGSIDTMVVRVDSIEVLQGGGQEIFTEIGCGVSREDKATNGGRTMVGLRAYQKVRLSVRATRTPEWTRWLKHMRQSPQRWIKIKDEGGNPLAKKIIFEAGGIKTYEVGVGIDVEMTGYLLDIPTQQGTEKLIL